MILATRLALALAILFAAACGKDDPLPSSDGGGDRVDAGPQPDADPPADASPACQALASDYLPREGSATDDWPACISDDNTYHRFDDSISTIARVAGFESIASVLFTGGDPTPQNFIDANLIYLEANGLESRVSRREDEHYPPAPMECRNLTPEQQQMFPDRCVGPVKMAPILNAAFSDGASGVEPRLNAVRIEATLLWFLYVSVHKEAITCTNVVADCDSHYAYYGGGEPREGGLGLSRYVKARSPLAHDRVWDGILAVRCWRDLDNPTGTATNLVLRDRAVLQLDRAALNGVSQIVRDRMVQLMAATDAADRDAAWTFVRILGPVLDRDATERDPVNAAILRSELIKTDPDDVNAEAFVGAIDGAFECP